MGAVWQHSFAEQNSVPAQHEALYEMFDWAIVALFSLSIVFFSDMSIALALHMCL